MKENLKLYNGYCHLVNETMFFIREYFEGIIPAGRVEEDIYWMTKDLYNQVQALLICGRSEQVESLLENYLAFSLEYLEKGNPRQTVETDRKLCRNTVLNSVQLMVNLTVLLETLEFEPAMKVSGWFDLSKDWQVHKICSGVEIPQVEDLR